MSLAATPLVGSPDYQDVQIDGSLAYGSWAEGLTPEQALAAANAPFTVDRYGAYVPASTVSWFESAVLRAGPNGRKWLLIAVVIVVALLLLKGRR